LNIHTPKIFDCLSSYSCGHPVKLCTTLILSQHRVTVLATVAPLRLMAFQQPLIALGLTSVPLQEILQRVHRNLYHLSHLIPIVIIVIVFLFPKLITEDIITCFNALEVLVERNRELLTHGRSKRTEPTIQRR
jgi:hypothetical protein